MDVGGGMLKSFYPASKVNKHEKGVKFPGRRKAIRDELRASREVINAQETKYSAYNTRLSWKNSQLL